MKTLVLGLGNPTRCDDGVGNRIAQVLQKEIHDPEVTVLEINAAGIELLELLPDYDRAIIIDAIQTSKGKVGQIYRLSLQDFASDKYPITTHGFGLDITLELAAKLGLILTKKITILAVEVEDVTTFSEDLTPTVKEAVPKVVELVLQEIKDSQNQ